MKTLKISFAALAMGWIFTGCGPDPDKYLADGEGTWVVETINYEQYTNGSLDSAWTEKDSTTYKFRSDGTGNRATAMFAVEFTYNTSHGRIEICEKTSGNWLNDPGESCVEYKVKNSTDTEQEWKFNGSLSNDPNRRDHYLNLKRVE